MPELVSVTESFLATIPQQQQAGSVLSEYLGMRAELLPVHRKIFFMLSFLCALPSLPQQNQGESVRDKELLA
jgi:hypothetical protein